MKYLEVCLNFKLLMDLVSPEDLPRDKRRIKVTMICFNAVFYSESVAITVARLFMLPEYPDVLVYFSMVNFAVSLMILIYSVIRLRRLVRQLGSPEVSNRECLMLVHTVIFCLYFVYFALYRLLIILKSSLDYNDKFCRIWFAMDVLHVFSVFLNDAFVVLFVYMTGKQFQ